MKQAKTEIYLNTHPISLGEMYHLLTYYGKFVPWKDIIEDWVKNDLDCNCQ
jgi:hypothetical protein